MGRVATLVKSPNDRVFGLAYEFRIDQLERLFEYLNFREKCGYSLNEVNFTPIVDSDERLYTICYYANEQNSYFSAEPNIDSLARQIFESVGPSGTNREYLFNLCKALRVMSVDFRSCSQDDILKYDEHLFKLESAVRQLENDLNSESKLI